MRFLVYEWTSYLKCDLYDILKEKGLSYQTFRWSFKNKNEDDDFFMWFAENVETSFFDALISINYWPLLSEVCQKYHLRYIAWCYDCPLNVERIEETLANQINYVFLFDQMQFYKYKNAGFDTVYHLPLGVNATRVAKYSFSDKDLEKYRCDVSFVGSLYESRINEILAPLSPYTKGYLDSLMDVQLKIYGHFLLDEMLSDSFLDDINAQYREVVPETGFVLKKDALVFAMSSEITRRERLILLHLCGKRFQTSFYGYHESEILKNVKRCARAEYYEELPKIYAASSVNLNPSLKCTQTGIPLRVFDILGAGGFLISNYQAELFECFEEGKELVVYESIEDAIEKITYFINHEDIRNKIALAGREKVLLEHTLQHRLKVIFDVVGI